MNEMKKCTEEFSSFSYVTLGRCGFMARRSKYSCFIVKRVVVDLRFSTKTLLCGYSMGRNLCSCFFEHGVLKEHGQSGEQIFT